MLDYFFLILGLCLLFYGGNSLVKGSVSLAVKINVPKFIIAATIIAFGTSLPELIVSIEAATSGFPELAIGNIIGSNISNILLVLGLPAMISVIVVGGGNVKKEAVLTLFSAGLIIIFSINNYISELEGGIMFFLILSFVFNSYWTNKSKNTASITNDQSDNEDLNENNNTIYIIFLIGSGLLGLFFGSDLLIKGAVGIATRFSISSEIIGLTVVAFGTSLPELITSLIAVLKKHSELVIGNVLGSNLFNTLGVAGITALITPIPVSNGIIYFDFIVMLITSLLLIILIVKKIDINRFFGSLLFISYLLYIWFQFYGVSGLK
ncbi:calcium/sodium antiporter [Alphaproteobacteria bacterium]|nr:calcium/sodium antiporter [Alphaproteobacteria bacterium]